MHTWLRSLAPLGALLLCACQTPGGPRGDAVALVRDVMVEAAREAPGPIDASAASAAVAAQRGEAEGADGGGLSLPGG